MRVLAGIFLIAHGLVHLVVWLPRPDDDAPFDPNRSWLFGEARPITRLLASAAALTFAVAGALVLGDAASAAAAALAGAAISTLLTILVFNPWLIGALAINAAIAWVALD
jgi:hypothetical protein